MDKRDAPKDEALRSKDRSGRRLLRPAKRFSRSDGRFDLPVVTGRTVAEVARRLA